MNANTTSGVKIYEVRNTTYQLGEELRFRIPPSVIAMNPLETYFTCHVEVGGTTAQQLANQYCLNEQIGAEALVREITILNGSESANLEQITSYSRLKRVLCYYGNNKTDDNLVKLMSGGQAVSPVLASNRLFNKSGTGDITQKKLEVMFKLSLSGIFSSTRPFPIGLTDGLVVKILLENDINKILERMSSQQVPRAKDAHNAAVVNIDFFKRPCGTAEEMCYQVATFGNDQTSPAAGGATDTALLINRAGAGNLSGGVADNTSIEGGNYQQIGTPTVEDCPFSAGQKLKVFVADSSDAVTIDLTGIAINGAGANARWELQFDATDLTGASSGSVGAGITSKVCILETGQSVGTVTGDSEKSTLTISNVTLHLGTLNLNPQELQKIQSAASSSKGFQWDYKSYVDYAVNITKALTNSAYIPCKLNRTKSILSFWEDVGSAIDGSRDNLLPIVDQNTVPSQVNYKINNLIVPNRPYSLSNYNREPDAPGQWNAIALSEMEKAIEQCGVQVKSLEDISQCLVIGRQLALYNHTFDMAGAKGETRLELNFTTQTRDLLIHNFVCHLRRLIITPQSTFVEM